MGFGKNVFLLLTCYILLLKADSKCQPSYPCRNFTLEFSFTDGKHAECGLFPVHGCHHRHDDYPRIDIEFPGFSIRILEQPSKNSFLMEDSGLQDLLSKNNCLALSNIPLINSHPSVTFTFSPNFTFFSCFNQSHTAADYFNLSGYKMQDCEFTHMYYKIPPNNGGPAVWDNIPRGCFVAQLPRSSVSYSDNLFGLLSSKFIIKWDVSEACLKCYRRGGQCLTNNQNRFYCTKAKDKGRLMLILALSISGAGVLLLLSVIYIIWQCKKKSITGYLRSRITSSSKSNIEGGIFYFGIPVFSYTELEEATNNFDPSKELGDGAFGTVYQGNLRDGREVAIKRLYERNFRRVEQFLNEIKILTTLRHTNLVSLYGCTSRTSRELLLVYEYISNGTVADHLHGERAKDAPLSWSIRVNIAIETATALAYLHKSEIIHRDVKTNNILLDNNYSVKVADFGISRLFPENVTHISTAPQGTPGYVDPEYHQCYQLTDKSDVYSFGVVLIELISSMPPVDVNRHRHDINLANLALNRIQRCAFDELIDPSLGYSSDSKVTRMTTTVAELAFRCLQVDKDLRPSMDEVVDFLKDIKGSEVCKFEQIKGVNGNSKIPPSPETDDVFLLKNENFQPSPTAITDAWTSSASTITSSIG